MDGWLWPGFASKSGDIEEEGIRGDLEEEGLSVLYVLYCIHTKDMAAQEGTTKSD